MNWEVTVTREGQSVITLGHNHLAGRDLSADDERAIRTAATHLLSFLGVTQFTEAAEARQASAWQPIADAPKRKKVLVSWVNALGNRRTTCAIYYDAGEIAMDDDVPDDCVDIGGDNAEGGWFEDCESRDPSYWPLNEPLTHFQLLPLAPPVLEDDAHDR